MVLEVSAADVLRRARVTAGLSQQEVAARAGVTQPEVSAYENGRRQPTVPTLERLIAATGHTLRLVVEPVAPYQPMTLADLAVQLQRTDSQSRRWRLFREFLKEFSHCPPDHRAALLAREPHGVDPRWDALLAATAEHLAWHDDLRCPEWTAQPLSISALRLVHQHTSGRPCRRA
ncbi:MAG: helix-turn-helix domain-containing protein [Egibacteraceae bacterium]